MQLQYNYSKIYNNSCLKNLGKSKCNKIKTKMMYVFCVYLEKCRPLKSDSLDLKCNLDGKYVDCSLPSIPGTTLIPSCKVTHSIPNGGVESPVVLLCLPDGQWRGDLYTCTPSNCLFYIFNRHSNVQSKVFT